MRVIDNVRGPLFSTFSIIGRCATTGRLGVGIATRALAVGARCPHVRAGAGAVSTQASTDPRLGFLALRLLALGLSAPRVVQEMVQNDPHTEYRQHGVVDRDGNAAGFTGAANKDWAGHLTGPNVVAMGNGLLGRHVAEAMFETFRGSESLDLEERLLRAIEAGRDAGGQHGGQRSSGLLVHDRAEYPWVDLRVDAHDEPIGEVRRIYEMYRPLREYFNLRAPSPQIGGEQEWLAARERGKDPPA